MEGAFRLPESEVHPFTRILRRVLFAVGTLIAAALLVWLVPGYTDEVDGDVTFMDALYFSTVSLSTTGYGDIIPVSDEARAVHIFAVTPLRVLFLLALIGASVEALASHTREQWRIYRWRRALHDHTVVIGFGVKGRSAVASLIENGIEPSQIVVVDPNQMAAGEANELGITAIIGNATRSEVLNRAEVAHAERIIVTTDRDDTSILATLTVRKLNPQADVSVAIREADNVDLARQGGASTVVPSSDAVGRILGLAAVSPPLGHVLEDLLATGSGMEVTERAVTPREEGRTPKQVDDVVLAVVRDERLYAYHEPAIGHLVRGDRIVVVRPSEVLPWARRADTDSEPAEEI
ncbi:MAG: potassium channel family protein [bacterium]